MPKKDMTEEKCGFCTPIGDGENGDPRSAKPIYGGYGQKNVLYLIQPNILGVSLGGNWGMNELGDFVIQYCPACGRKLIK